MSLENFYGFYIKYILKAINPFKKLFITTECKVHLFNNYCAIKLLKDYRFNNEYEFFKKYIYYINHGSIWADQDFKSSNHFYNPIKKRGLFGHSNSKRLSQKYYNIAIKQFKENNIPLSMFYLGASVHIIQDLTIPQHVKIRLLNYHRKYENYVKYTYNIVSEYISNDPPVILNNPKDYIEYNARVALKVDKAYKDVCPLKIRFHKITLSSLPLAQSTTAGCFIKFYEVINS